MQSAWKKQHTALSQVLHGSECVHKHPGTLTARAESACPWQGPRICISNQLPGQRDAAGPQTTGEGATMESQGLWFFSSPRGCDVATFSGKGINLLQGQTDLGYNPDPNTLWPNY